MNPVTTIKDIIGRSSLTLHRDAANLHINVFEETSIKKDGLVKHWHRLAKEHLIGHTVSSGVVTLSPTDAHRLARHLEQLCKEIEAKR